MQQARAVERDLHLVKHSMLWNVGKVGKDNTVGELRMLHKIPPGTRTLLIL